MWHEVQLAGTGESVRCWQAGEGPPLVYLHGVEGLREEMPLLRLLAERHRVVAPVHPGFGGSPPLQATTMADVAAFYRDFLRGIGQEEPIVVGHCLGGMFAAELAVLVLPVTVPLVLVAPLGLWSDEAPVADLLSLDGAEWRRCGWAGAGTADSMPVAPREGDPQAAAAAAACVWPIPDHGLRDRLLRLRQRTLLVWGRQDRLVPPALAREFMESMPHAAIELLDDCGHFPMDEQPGRVSSLVEDFVSGGGQ